MHSKYSIHPVGYGLHTLVLHLLEGKKMKNIQHVVEYVGKKDKLYQQYHFECIQEHHSKFYFPVTLVIILKNLKPT